MTSTLRKFGVATVVACIVSWIVYPFLCWIFIFPLGPAHPDVAPREVFNEAISDTLMVGVVFAGLQLLSCLCALRLITKASFRLVGLVAGAVPAIVLLLSLCFRDWLSLATPIRAVRVISLVLAFTFALLYCGTRKFCSHAK